MCSSTLFTFFRIFEFFLICTRNVLQKRIQRRKKTVQNSTTFQSKNEKVPVSRELIRVGFSIDFALSVPLGHQKIPPTKISNRIQW